MPEVSIIIAIYNVERYLKKCLDSVCSQTFSNIEIIAVNDGSTDDSLALLQEYTSKDNRIVVINKSNGGLSDARNAGMKVAKGTYLAFLDGDDSYSLDFVEKMLKKAKNNGCDLVCCTYELVWEDGRKSKEINFLSPLPLELNREEAISAFLRQEIIGSVTIKIFRKAICDHFDLSFPKGQNWEDITFTFAFLSYCKRIGILKESLYYYLQMSESITRKKDSLGILDIMKASEGCVQRCEELYPNMYEREKKTLLTRSFICLLVYSFKVKNESIRKRLKEELQNKRVNTSLVLLNWSEKALILLYRFNYNISRYVFLRIYKRNQQF